MLSLRQLIQSNMNLDVYQGNVRGGLRAIDEQANLTGGVRAKGGDVAEGGIRIGLTPVIPIGCHAYSRIECRQGYGGREILRVRGVFKYRGAAGGSDSEIQCLGES